MRLLSVHIIPLILFALVSWGNPLQAQVIDEVCPSIPYGNYGVTGASSSAYFWQVTGGQIVQSNGKDSIRVEWDFTQPQFRLSVVEVSVHGCVGDTVYAEVTKGIDPLIYISGSDSLCAGSSTLLTAYGGLDYIWSTQENKPTISAQIYFDSSFFVVGNDGCGFDTAFFDIKAMPLPTADFEYAPKEVKERENVIFTYTGTGGKHFQWYFDNSLSNDDNDKVTYSFNTTGKHQVFLYVESDFQCADTLSKVIYVKENMTNSFTPDGDGVNDTWVLEELNNFPNCRVWIFDRSGAEVFYSEGYHEPWDGMRNGDYLPVGTYYYIIDYGVDNQSEKGMITILR